MSNTIHVVVPCHTARQLPWVVATLERQTHRDIKLIVVENGEAIGACKRYGIPADVVVTSAPHVVHARNEGIAQVKRMGGGRIAMMDCDDYYGPGYLAELEHAFRVHVESPGRKVQVLGKHRHFCYMQGAGMYLFANRFANGLADVLHGPTLAFRTEDAVEYPMQREAEEYAYCQAIRKKGGQVWALSINHFCYLRSADSNAHTWKTGIAELLRNSASPGCQTYWFGPRFDPALVDAERDWRHYIATQVASSHTLPLAIPKCDTVPLRRLFGGHHPMGQPLPSGVINRLAPKRAS